MIFYGFWILFSTSDDWVKSVFWSVFSGIRTEYGFSPYSVRKRENMDQKLRIWLLFTRWHLFKLNNFGLSVVIILKTNLNKKRSSEARAKMLYLLAPATWEKPTAKLEAYEPFPSPSVLRNTLLHHLCSCCRQ